MEIGRGRLGILHPPALKSESTAFCSALLRAPLEWIGRRQLGSTDR